MQACKQPLGKNAGKNKKKRANKKRRAAAIGKSSGAMTAQLGANRATVPQWFKISPDQVFNHAGGAVWKLTDAEHTMRYLIMGAKDNGNYYQTSEQVSSECSTSVLKMIRNPDPAEFQKLCEMLESISTQGRAARQEPTLLSLAAAIVFATTPAQKSMALGGNVCASRRTCSCFQATSRTSLNASQTVKKERDGAPVCVVSWPNTTSRDVVSNWPLLSPSTKIVKDGAIAICCACCTSTQRN